MLAFSDIVMRLGIATLAGGIIGLNRDLKGKPIGMRTLSLVALASALLVAIAEQSLAQQRIGDPTSRVIQGILTGIGFLGAGVIVHTGRRNHVHGLTTAACVWLAACIGIACGSGHWLIVGVALVMAFTVLLSGHAVETTLHRLLGGKTEEKDTIAPED